MKTVNARDLQKRIKECVDMSQRGQVVVTRRGKPAAVLVNYAEYERLKESLDVLSDPDLMRQISQSRAFYSKGGAGLSFEQVFDEPLRHAKRRKT